MLKSLYIVILLTLSVEAAWANETKEKKHILFLGASVDWAHDSVSHAMYTMEKIGKESGLFDVRFHTDLELLTKEKLGSNKKNLNYFDAIMFFSQGDLLLTEQQNTDIMSFIKEDGKGFLGTHSATDSFRASWPEYIEMVGGAFDSHPWHQKVRIRVEDRTFPITKHLPPIFEITDEIYQLDHYSRSDKRVLMSLDTTSIDLNAKNVRRSDRDFAIAWARQWGTGRVFVNLLGHRREVWDNPSIQKIWLEAVRWVLKFTHADLTPLPQPTQN